jgi:hypothetical protein
MIEDFEKIKRKIVEAEKSEIEKDTRKSSRKQVSFFQH